jgi:hypothetical protein
LLVCAALLAPACAPEQGAVDLPVRDQARFEAEIQPIVGSGCGSLDCHGDSGRPLRLYARYGRRADAALRDSELTAAELADNVAAFAGLPDDRLLGKPLAVDGGGMHHEGGDLWPDRDAPEYRCLEAWLTGGADPASCAAALERVPY